MAIFFYLRRTQTNEQLVLTANQADLNLHVTVKNDDNGLEILRRTLVGQEDHNNRVYIGADQFSVTDILRFIAFELTPMNQHHSLSHVLEGHYK